MGSLRSWPLGCAPVDDPTPNTAAEQLSIDSPEALPAIDQERLMRLVDELERDIALVEGAMAHVEAREFRAANAALDVLDGVSTA